MALCVEDVAAVKTPAERAGTERLTKTSSATLLTGSPFGQFTKWNVYLRRAYGV